MQQEIEQKAKELYPDNMGGLDQSSVERYRAGYLLGCKHGATNTGVNDSAMYELRLALYDMIRTTKALIENRGTLLNARKRVEAAEEILKKHFKITDALRTESHEQPVEQKEPKNEFVDIVDNCLKEGKIVLDELKKHNALREQKEEAVEFAEHCKMLPFNFIRGIGWNDPVTGTEWTTERLYNEWKLSNK